MNPRILDAINPRSMHKIKTDSGSYHVITPTLYVRWKVKGRSNVVEYLYQVEEYGRQYMNGVDIIKRWYPHEVRTSFSNSLILDKEYFLALWDKNTPYRARRF